MALQRLQWGSKFPALLEERLLEVCCLGFSLKQRLLALVQAELTALYRGWGSRFREWEAQSQWPVEVSHSCMSHVLHTAHLSPPGTEDFQLIPLKSPSRLIPAGSNLEFFFFFPSHRGHIKFVFSLFIPARLKTTLPKSTVS